MSSAVLALAVPSHRGWCWLVDVDTTMNGFRWRPLRILMSAGPPTAGSTGALLRIHGLVDVPPSPRALPILR